VTSGQPNGLPRSARRAVVSRTTWPRCVGWCGRGASGCRFPSRRRPTATQPRSRPGRTRGGRNAQKGGNRRTNRWLDRCSQLLPAASACPHVRPTRWPTSAAGCVDTRPPVGDQCRDDERTRPAAGPGGGVARSTGGALAQASLAPPPWHAARDLGWRAAPPEEGGQALAGRGWGGTKMVGAAPQLRAGPHSGGRYLALPEAGARTECLLSYAGSGAVCAAAGACEAATPSTGTGKLPHTVWLPAFALYAAVNKLSDNGNGEKTFLFSSLLIS
jgi:hypothetical protein